MKKSVLVVHSAGLQGPGQGSHDFVAKLKKALGAGYAVAYPKMPQPDRPSYAAWKKRLKRALASYGSGDEVILVGHSLGGSVLLKLLSEEKIDVKIRGLFLAATPFWGGDRNWNVSDFVLAKDFPSKLPPVPEIFLYHSRDDDGVPFGHLALYSKKLPRAVLRKLDGQGHVFEKGLPELAEDILNMDKKKREGKGGPAKARSAKAGDADKVDAYMEGLAGHPFNKEIEALRIIVKKANPKIEERIKWNAPSYFYKEDMAAFNPRAKGCAQIIFLFPRGLVEDRTGLLEGPWPDRRFVKFTGMADIRAKKKALKDIVNLWIKKMDGAG